MLKLNDIYKKSNTFMKKAQVLQPGTSEKDPQNLSQRLIDKRTAAAKAAHWLQLIENSGKERRPGWSKEILKTILEAVSNNEPEPIEKAKQQFEIPTSQETIKWAILDAESHYTDLIPTAELRQVLAVY